MSACAMLNYNHVTPEAWQCGQEVAAQYGVTINTDSGSTTVHGFTMAWNYDSDAETLQLQCTDSPFFIPCSLINSKINDQVETCLDTHHVVMTAMVNT